MIALRYLYVLALAAWLGGMLALGGLAAPSIFAVLQQHGGGAGRVLAGDVFGDILWKYHLGAYACGTVMLLMLAGMRVLGPKPVQFGIRAGIVLAMLAVAVYSGVIISGQIQTLQQEIGGSVAALEATDARRVAFGQLHGVSMALMLVDVIGASVLLFWEARD